MQAFQFKDLMLFPSFKQRSNQAKQNYFLTFWNNKDERLDKQSASI